MKNSKKQRTTLIIIGVVLLLIGCIGGRHLLRKLRATENALREERARKLSMVNQFKRFMTNNAVMPGGPDGVAASRRFSMTRRMSWMKGGGCGLS
jgi:hypothetical protein